MEAEYIKRIRVQQIMRSVIISCLMDNDHDTAKIVSNCLDELNKIPAIPVREASIEKLKCSHCGKIILGHKNYCSRCGAKLTY